MNVFLIAFVQFGFLLAQAYSAEYVVYNTRRGAFGFKEVSPYGESITLENVMSSASAAVQNLTGWTVVKEVNGRNLFTIDLPDRELGPDETFVIYAMRVKAVATDENEMVADGMSFGTGTGVFRLLDDDGQEEANWSVRLVNQ